MKHFARMGDFIVTAQPDGTVTLNALVAAELAPGTDFPEELVRQANAAPDLLAALEDVMREFKERECADPACKVCAVTVAGARKARAAIAKAKGDA